MEIVKPDWKREGRLYFARHGREWLVATNRSPFFCFEKRTKAECRAVARKAFEMAGGMGG